MLKLNSAAVFNAFLIAFLEITASVTIKESMVAISGAIIPLPFVIPAILTISPLVNVISTASSFGKVSVVIIAFAAAREFSGLLPNLEIDS